MMANSAVLIVNPPAVNPIAVASAAIEVPPVKGIAASEAAAIAIVVIPNFSYYSFSSEPVF